MERGRDFVEETPVVLFLRGVTGVVSPLTFIRSGGRSSSKGLYLTITRKHLKAAKPTNNLARKLASLLKEWCSKNYGTRTQALDLPSDRRLCSGMPRRMRGFALHLWSCAVAAFYCSAISPVVACSNSLAASREVAGRLFNIEVERLVLSRTNSVEVRVVRPGFAASSDYRARRVTILLDIKDRIVAVTCG
ncbi:I78 family peptidase inhibitor [Bosea vestrisii]|uniref:I78 family peptidase inhibitor n=1 Tax=Bosea vestrisii TaxID=151416 RepID=UPI003D7689C2